MGKKLSMLLILCLIIAATNVHAQAPQPTSQLKSSIENPVDGIVVQASFEVKGWAIDSALGAGFGPGIDLIRIYAGETCDGTVLGEVAPSIARPDVIKAFQLDESYANSGFATTVVASGLGPLAFTVCAHDVPTNALVTLKTRTVYVTAAKGTVDEPKNNKALPLNQNIELKGWVIDPNAGAGNGPGIDLVQLYAGVGCEGQLLGETSPLLPRADVVNALGLDESYTNSGYSFNLTPDTEATLDLTVCAKLTTTQALTIVALRTYFVTRLQGTLDMPKIDENNPRVSLPLYISGWVVDPAAGPNAGPGVDQVAVFSGIGCGGTPLVQTPLTVNRPPVAEYLQMDSTYAASGFEMSLRELPLGANTLTTCARSTVTGNFSVVKVIKLIVAVQ